MSNDKGPPRPKVFDNNYGKYKRSKKHEERIGHALHGRRIPRSGGLSWSSWDSKTAGADIRGSGFKIEHKRTERKSLSITLDWLLKVREGAAISMLEPALAFTFERGPLKPEDWVAVPLDVFERLIRKVGI